MATYPIYVARDAYAGSKPALRASQDLYNADAKRVEDYVNDQFRQHPSRQEFLYASIALALKLPTERVKRMLTKIGGGHNGLSVTPSADGEL